MTETYAADLSDEEASKLDVGSYTASDFFEDVMQVTEYAADKKLTNILVDQSYATARWLTEMNVKWILSTSTHAVKVGGKMRFPSGRCPIDQRRRTRASRNALCNRGKEEHRHHLRSQGDWILDRSRTGSRDENTNPGGRERYRQPRDGDGSRRLRSQPGNARQISGHRWGFGGT